MFCTSKFHTRGRRPSNSYAGQVVVAGGRTPARFGAAPRQHGDLGAEVVAAAADRRVLIFGVGAHVPLQVPPPPLPLDLPLDLQKIQPIIHLNTKPFQHEHKQLNSRIT